MLGNVLLACLVVVCVVGYYTIYPFNNSIFILCDKTLLYRQLHIYRHQDPIKYY